MMLFIRTVPTAGSRIHQVEIPADYMLFEASYYYYIYYHAHGYPERYWDSKLKVDGAVISDAHTWGAHHGNEHRWWRLFDSYKGAITTGTLHTIEISYENIDSEHDVGSAGVATVLIYRTA